MATNSRYTLTVPIDASAVDDAKGDVRVALLDASGGVVQTATVTLDAKKQAAAAFRFDKPPAIDRVIIGPGHIEESLLPKLQTIREIVPAGAFTKASEVKLQPLLISPYYWNLWWRWCRDFTITGTIRCPDGKPVPGAKVCAYDADWFGIWQSTQLIGCAYTDINGSFQLKFRWCCGFWPWWWWWLREWKLDLHLADRLIKSLPPELKGRPLPPPGPQPDLHFFDALVSEPNKRLNTADATVGVKSTEQSIGRFITATERLRPQVEKILPRIPGPFWPWYPWQPWYDCNPDVIFTATQECDGKVVTIVDQDFDDVQSNIPTDYHVSLRANENACCRPDHHRCGDADCVILTHACSIERGSIGQDVSPLGLPLAGFVNPGQAAAMNTYADRPFAGNVVVEGTTECMGSDAEYYEVEYSQYDSITNSWSGYAPVPSGSLGGFTRTYLEFVLGNPPIWHHPTFAPVPLGGKLVYESRLHYESTHPWLCMASCEVLFVWVTDSATWADGLYKLRLHPYKFVAGVLQDVPLDSCGEHHVSDLALRLDNRPLPDPLHPASAPGHPCGPNTVHLCSVQPDVDVQDVRLYHAATHTTEHIEACKFYDFADGDYLDIDILAYDVDLHLANYTLITTFGENESRDLLAGATLVNVSADYVGSDYAAAVAQGATEPQWRGGVITVRIPADKMCEKFPYSCCYQLELRAWKRTIVNCSQDFAHNNLAEYSFFLGNKAHCP